MGMNRYLVLREKRVEDLQNLLTLAQQMNVEMPEIDSSLIIQLITVRTGSAPEPCRPPPPLLRGLKELPKPRRPVPQLPPGARPPAPPVPGMPAQPPEERPAPPASPPPEISIDLMAPLPEPRFDKNSCITLSEQAWNYLELVVKKAKVDPDFILPWDLTDEQIADPVNLDALVQMTNPYYDGSVKHCGVCNNVLTDDHPQSKKHLKRMEEVTDRNWRISDNGKETIRNRRMQAFHSMLVDRLSWECCTQECQLKRVPPPVCIPRDPGPAAEAPAYTASPGEEWIPGPGGQELFMKDGAWRLKPGPPTGKTVAPEPEQSIIAPGGSSSGASGAAPAAAAGARAGRWKGARQGQTEEDIGHPARYQTAEEIQEALTPVPQHPQATLETTPALQPQVQITAELLKKLDESQPRRPWWETRSLGNLKGVDPASESAWTDPNYSVI